MNKDKEEVNEEVKKQAEQNEDLYLDDDNFDNILTEIQKFKEKYCDIDL